MNRTRWNTKTVADEMAKEGCKLLDQYVNGSTRIRYEYQGNEYSVRWYDWNKSVRPSRPLGTEKGPRPSPESTDGLISFADFARRSR